ncbi:DUF317 domain-containing protein [Streptomyces platensis]|uniref:DUF317 domain-containing protein n=1 Tax=Streptomyces platensis TaxID=58346 RepID=UPI0038632423
MIRADHARRTLREHADRLRQIATDTTLPDPAVAVLAQADALVGSALDEKSVTAATRPLVEAGWKHGIDGRWLRWTNLSEDAGVQFGAFAAQNPSSSLATWTIWAGPSIGQSTWALHASPHAPASMIASLATELAHGTGTRRPLRPGSRPSTP